MDVDKGEMSDLEFNNHLLKIEAIFRMVMPGALKKVIKPKQKKIANDEFCFCSKNGKGESTSDESTDDEIIFDADGIVERALDYQFSEDSGNFSFEENEESSQEEQTTKNAELNDKYIAEIMTALGGKGKDQVFTIYEKLNKMKRKEISEIVEKGIISAKKKKL